MNYQKIVFDCDSTLTAIEGIDHIAKDSKNYPKIKLMTKQAMSSGELSYQERLNLLEFSHQDLLELAMDYYRHRSLDVEWTIKILQDLGKECYVVSSGMNPAVNRFARMLGFPEQNIYAVDLEFSARGEFIGVLGHQVLTTINGKRVIIEKIKGNDTLAMIGDGYNDAMVRGIADLVIGYGGWVHRPSIQAKFDVYCMHKSFKGLLELVLSPEELSKILK